MSAPMKKPRTNEVEIVVHEGGVKTFRVPKEKAKGFLLLLNEFRVMSDDDRSEQDSESVPSSEVFRELDEKFGRAGAALQGARLKEGLSQLALAEILQVSQSDLSKMEHGKRSIGKAMARKLASALKVDYRVFL